VKTRVTQARVIPVVTGVTGTISKSFRKYVSKIPGNMTLRNYRKQPF
jgi:RNase P/RNase MRP subunit POP5